MELPKCRVREIRKERGMKPAQLAAAVGITTQQLWNIETGRTSSPRHETVRRLAEALHCTYSDLWPPVTDGGASEAEAFRGM